MKGLFTISKGFHLVREWKKTHNRDVWAYKNYFLSFRVKSINILAALEIYLSFFVMTAKSHGVPVLS